MSPARIASADKRDLRYGKRVKWARSIRSSPRIYFYRGKGWIFRFHLPFDYNFFLISNFPRFQPILYIYIVLFLSFFFLSYRNISLRDTKRNNLFSYLSTLTRREDGEGKFLSRLRLRDQNNRYLFSVTYPKHGYENEIRRISRNIQQPVFSSIIFSSRYYIHEFFFLVF